MHLFCPVFPLGSGLELSLVDKAHSPDSNVGSKPPPSTLRAQNRLHSVMSPVPPLRPAPASWCKCIVALHQPAVRTCLVHHCPVPFLSSFLKAYFIIRSEAIAWHNYLPKWEIWIPVQMPSFWDSCFPRVKFSFRVTSS